MFNSLRHNTEFRGSTNVESLLPKRGDLVAHGQLQGVHFPCVSPACKEKDTVLAYAEAAAPRGAAWGAWWEEIVCTMCGARYLIRWPGSDEDGETVVQRVEL
jgi:hypothetical protein